MKDLAWYHKLWRDKLGELPLKKDDTAGWADMRNLLDEELPETPIGGNAYRLSTPIRVLLALFVAATITLPVVIYNAKYNTIITKNSKHLPLHTTGNNRPDKPFNQSQNQPLTDLTEPDSAHDQAGISTESSTQNQIRRTNAILVTANNKSGAGNSDSQLSGIDGLNTKKPKGNIKPEDNITLSNALTSRKPASFNKGLLKRINKYSDNAIANNKQNYQSSKRNYSVYAHHGVPNRESFNSPNREYGMSMQDKQPSSVKGTNSKENADNNLTGPANKKLQANNDKEAADTKIDPVKNSTNNANTKEVKSPGSKSRVFDSSPKTVKTKENKSKSNIKKSKTDDAPPKYNYGLETGYNVGHGSSLYAGAFGSYQVKSKWLINIGLRLNTYKTISGEYSHQSYYSPDSIPAFKVTDSRKVMALTIPITLEYKLSKNISLKGGPVISMPIKQSGISTRLGAVPDTRDTIYHTQIIDSALKKTVINKVNIGFTGGVSIQIKHLNIEAMYQVLTPYKVSSGLGSYQKSNQNFQIGIGYRFK
jgi:hypothetical protein